MKKESLVPIMAFACLAISLFCTPPPPASESQSPAPPSGQLASDTLAPMPSVVNVPVRMKRRVIEEMLNTQLSGLLYGCDALTLGAIKPVKIKVLKAACSFSNPSRWIGIIFITSLLIFKNATKHPPKEAVWKKQIKRKSWTKRPLLNSEERAI